MMPGALAQDASDVTVEIEVDDGCDWTGTPYLSTSTLDVWDNEICIIQGTGREALTVTVHEDGVIKGGGGTPGGQAGGRLIIGSDTIIETVFTVGGTFNANGIVEVGAAGNEEVNSTLITNGNLNISATGSDGDFDIISNNNFTPLRGINTIDVNNNPMLVGSASTTGSFTNNDNSTSTIHSFIVYGDFENLHASGVITTDGANVLDIETGSTFDNDGTFNADTDLNMNGVVSADNSGEVNVTNGHWFIGSTDAGIVTFNNSGDININTTGKWFMVQHSTAATNTGTITTPQFLVQHGATFNNNSGGTVDSSVSGGFFVVYGDATYGNGTFNNNSGGIVTTDEVWVVDPDFGTGPNYTDRPTLNNNDGASFTAGSIDFSWDDLGDWLGITAYGSILNNDGTFIVTDDGADAVSMYRGAKLNNTANGTFTLSGTASEIEMSKSTGGAFTSECGATADIKCQITNTNVTDADAFSVSGDISLWQYAELNNNGNMAISGANNIDIEENNVSVINGSNGNLDLEGTNEEFNFNVTVDNDGDIDTTTASIVMSDTAILDNAGNITVNDDTAIYDNSTVNVTAGTLTTGTLNVGTGTTTQGGVLNITSTGALVTSGAVAVTRGVINNTSSATTSMNFGGTITMRGEIGDRASIDSSGKVLSQRVDIWEDADLNINGNIWEATENSWYVFGDGSTHFGIIDVALGAQLQGVLRLYLGQSSIAGGTLINAGVVANDGTPAGDDMTIHIYNGGQIDNSGTIDLYKTSTQSKINLWLWENYTRKSKVTNQSGATIETNDFYSYHADQIIDNDGTILIQDDLLLGTSNPSYYGGTLENDGSVQVTDMLDIHSGGIVNNNPDATISAGQIIIQDSSSYYYQDERSASSSTKTTSTGLIDIQSGATFQTEDLVQAAGLSVDGDGSYYHQTFNVTAANSVTTLTAASTIDASSGTATVDIDAGTTITTNSAFSVDTGGDVDNSGILTLTGTGGTNNLKVDGGNYESSTGSTLNLAGTPGMQMSLDASTVEIAGTVTSGTSFQNEGGELCLGQWNAGVGTLASCIDSTNDITLSALTVDTLTTPTSDDTDVYIASDLEVQGDIDVDSIDDAAVSVDITQKSSSYLQITQNGDLSINQNSIPTGQNITFNSDGHMDIQGSGLGSHGHIRAEGDATVSLNHTSNDYDIGSLWLLASNSEASAVTLASGATLNLNDTHTANLGGAVISLNDNTGDGSATFTTNGTTNLNSGSTQNLTLGYTTSTDGTGELEVGSGGSLQHTNGSTGNVDINATGRLEVIDDSNADKDVDINGTLTVGGDYNDGTGNRGAYIGGQLENETTLTIMPTGFMDVGSNGDVTVAGSTTSVSGNMELDGTLNPGNLTVTSTGVISSGDGNPVTSGMGCGPGADFGCGTSTNFYIDATSLDVDSGGKITSDYVSIADRDSSVLEHGGSYGGEGIISGGSPDSTYGATKISSPTYGDQGEGVTDDFSAYGGGGVNINVTGNIIIDGDVSANGGDGGTNTILKYDAQTVEFTIGETLTGGTSTDTATILGDIDDGGATGTLILGGASGPFQDNETITDGSGGSADADGVTALHDGAGAGGTVIITHAPSASGAYFSGTGTITADGGDGDYPGGGGRILIESPLLDDPDFVSYDFGKTNPSAGTVSAYGGDDGVSEYAAAGTIVYTGDGYDLGGTPVQNDDTLIIDQGGNAPTSTSITDLADAASVDWDRIEVDGAASADLTNASPQVCYALASSTISGSTTCDSTTALPDKPDSLHIQTSWTGTTAGTATEEPGYIAGAKPTGVSDIIYPIGDIKPVFAMYFRNPDTTAGALTYEVVEIQVDDTDNTFGSLVWDARVGGADDEVTLNIPVSDGDWTEDIEYAGNALTVGATYYVRARFKEDALSSPGLWTHADYNTQYMFKVSSYGTIWVENCNDGGGASTNMVLTQDGTDLGDDMSPISGQRYGYGTCDVHVSTSETAWEVYSSMDTGETSFLHTNASDVIGPINNPTDCLINDLGTDGTEEYGFNIQTYTDTTDNTTINANVETDTECGAIQCAGFGKYNESQDGDYNNNCYFDFETLANKDTILDTDVGTPASVNDGKYTMNVHANMNYGTTGGDYSVDGLLTITTNP